MRQTKIVVTRYGGPEVITVIEQECAAPMPREVRVKVLAAGATNCSSVAAPNRLFWQPCSGMPLVC